MSFNVLDYGLGKLHEELEPSSLLPADFARSTIHTPNMSPKDGEMVAGGGAARRSRRNPRRAAPMHNLLSRQYGYYT
jgi:hypothetical protein